MLQAQICEAKSQSTEVITQSQTNNNETTQALGKTDQEKNEIAIRGDIRLSIEELKKSIKEELNLQRKEIEKVEITAKANEKRMSFHFTVVSLFACGVIAISGLILGFSAFRFIVYNRRIFERTKKSLDQEFSPWLDNKKKECEGKIKQLYTNYEDHSQQFLQFVRLKFIIEQPNPEANEVYPLLTPLTSNPRLEYAPLFNKIINLNIHAQISAKAQEGINKLKNVKKQLDLSF
jgi:hypothetical protein